MAKKKTGTAIANWDQELADLAATANKGAAVGTEGAFLSFSGGRMSFRGADIPDDEVECVIVGWTHHNAYYDPDVRYDPKNPQTPICYAFGVEEKEMEPLDSVPDKQCDACADCPFNQFESAKSGRGKACKNTYRLALIARDDLEDMDKAEVIYASVPPKSLKNWAQYLKELDKIKRPYFTVVTSLARVPDDESQFKLTFKRIEVIDDRSLFGPLKELWTDTMEKIDFPYVVRDNPAPARGKAKAAPKKNSKFARR